MPRSVSEFNLAGVGDIALPPPPPSMLHQRSPPILSHGHHPSGTIMIPMHTQTGLPPPKPREKTVTFEDDPKCPHGLPATPSRKTGPMVVGDVFM